MSSSALTLPPADPLAGILEPAAVPSAGATLPAARDAGAGLSTRTVHYLADCKGEPA